MDRLKQWLATKGNREKDNSKARNEGDQRRPGPEPITQNTVPRIRTRPDQNRANRNRRSNPLAFWQHSITLPPSDGMATLNIVLYSPIAPLGPLGPYPLGCHPLWRKWNTHKFVKLTWSFLMKFSQQALKWTTNFSQ